MTRNTHFKHPEEGLGRSGSVWVGLNVDLREAENGQCSADAITDNSCFKINH